MSSERLVHIVDEVPGLDELERLTMVVVLDGFLDAGSSAAVAVRHLVDLGSDTALIDGALVEAGLDGPVAPAGGSVVATFDVDELHDYRARRPVVTFARDHYEGYDAPRLVVRLLRDSGGTPYLLLHGPEPDNRWEAFARAVREVVVRFDVSLVVGMGSVPMAVPHTRPIAITHHANNEDLLTGESPWRGELRVPSSAQALLEIRLGEWGHDAQGFVAHIPHYLAQLDYPRAATELLEQVERAGRLTIDLTDLREAAEQREIEISRYLSANEEVGEIVASLERQYDAFARADDTGPGLLADDQPLPTGDEIGRQFEQFLAGLESPEDPETPQTPQTP